MPQDITPIIVEVKDDRWDAYSINPEPTERDKMLLAKLQELGGVREGVAPGLWSFNIIEVEGLQTLHLLPFKKK